MSKLIRFVSRLQAAEQNARKATFILSTSAEDRAGDTIDQSGWMLDNYRANPVVLWAHNTRGLPIGRCPDPRPTQNALVGDVFFTSAEEYEFGDTVYRLCKGGFINAGSVGFMSHEYEVRYGEKGEFQGINFKRNELTEFTICPVPMNSQALAIARSFGAGETTMQRLEEGAGEITSDYPALRAELLGVAQPSAKAAIHRAKVRAAAMANVSKLI